MVEEDDFELLSCQCLKCSFGILRKYCFGQALPKPRDAIFSVFYNQNWLVSRNVKLLTHRHSVLRDRPNQEEEQLVASISNGRTNTCGVLTSSVIYADHGKCAITEPK